jgi:broad specificity phosphatase PhoE
MLAPTLLATVLSFASIATAWNHGKNINYTVVPGLFVQDDPATNVSGFDFIASNFGLINRSYPSDSSCPENAKQTQWQRLAHYINTLNDEAPNNERYALLYIGRHGEGVHNAAETFFGTPAWNCYWSERDGNGTVTWADAHLTEVGVQQANKVNAFWASLIKDQKITPPQTFYTSPLYRCLDTARIVFTGLDLPRRYRFKPEIKELLREGISAHTCDRRSSKTYIRQQFPTFNFEDGFVENDPYWTPLMTEPSTNQDIRSRTALNDIFSNDNHTYMSITSHSGEIASLLRGKSIIHFPTNVAKGD